MNRQPTHSITHVCICLSQYGLLQFMLLNDEDTVRHHTFYFFNEHIEPNVQKHFQHSVFIPVDAPQGAERWKRKWRIAWLVCFRYWKYPFLKTAKLYFSGMSYLSILVRGRAYDLLQDAPNNITFHANADSAYMLREQARFHSWRGKLKFMLMGPTTLYECLYKSRIDTIHLTESNTSPALSKHHVEVKPFAALWQEASESKKQHIRKVFGIEASQEDDSQQHTMFLTQPLVDDGILTADEYTELLRRIFSQYDPQSLLIKRHPRDHFDYSTPFPHIAIYDKKVNLELLLLTGLRLDRAIAICSTAVNSLPPSIELDWYGSAVHPKLAQYIGNTIKPLRPYRQCAVNS